MFHFYSLLCEIAFVPRKLPNAWIAADRLATSGRPAAGKEKERAAGAHINHGGKRNRLRTITTGSGAVSNLGHVMSFDARALARECLKEVGRELGVPQ
jgi:protein MON2